MPCRDDWPTPTEHNRYLQRTAQLLLYVWDVRKSTPKTGNALLVVKAAKDEFCDFDSVPVLCEEIRSMKKKELDKIVYNARSKESRDLANWWEAHQEADRKREATERAEIVNEELRRTALKKLTAAEKKALGLKP